MTTIVRQCRDRHTDPRLWARDCILCYKVLTNREFQKLWGEKWDLVVGETIKDTLGGCVHKGAVIGERIPLKCVSEPPILVTAFKCQVHGECTDTKPARTGGCCRYCSHHTGRKDLKRRVNGVKQYQTGDRESVMPKTWAYGITTIFSRLKTYLPQTMRSLAAAGFPKPWLFVDGARDPSPWEDLEPAGVSCRWPITNLVTNWQLALWELMSRNPACERYALFQDDVLAVKNLRQFLDTQKMRPKTYWSLVTFKRNDLLVADRGQGWHESREVRQSTPEQKLQCGEGALGYVFDRQAVFDLLAYPSFVQKVASAELPNENLDGCVVNAMNYSGYTEMLHKPSPLSHIGVDSTFGQTDKELGAHGQRLDIPRTWEGEEFDAMSWANREPIEIATTE